jgi:4-amino-4-deoxy-L-arabinose transferase-like glycosyltransferase
VTQTDNSAVVSTGISPVARIAWIVLILATLYICYFHNLGALGLIGPDEPRYAWIARDMAETGDWVTPRLYGKPWFEKPVLYYWAAALSFKVFGVSEVAARLPSAVAALLATLTLAWLAWRVWGADTARWLLLVLPTTVGMIGFSHAAATDMPFTAMLTIAMVFAARLLRVDPSASLISFTSSSSFTSFFLGVFLGLAALAKGPAAIVLCGGAILLWAAFSKRWRDALRCLHPIAIAGFGLTALPWYVLCAHRNPDFFHVFIIEHNFKRYLTPEFQHIQPFWFYIPIILVAVFPWTLLFIPAVRRFFRDKKERQPEFAFRLFVLVWAMFPLVFFSISQSKIPGYVLPAVPPLILLLVGPPSCSPKDKQGPVRWPGLMCASGLIGLAVLFFAAGRLLAHNFPYRLPTASALFFFAFVTGLAAIIVGFLAGFRLNAVALFATISVLLFLVVQTDNILKQGDADFTARQAAAEARTLWPDFSANRAGIWQIQRSLAYQLNFYTHAQLEDWTPPNAKPEWLFIDPARIEEARARDFACVDFSGHSAVVPCRKRDSSAAGLNGFGGLARGNNGNSADRQPR